MIIRPMRTKRIRWKKVSLPNRSTRVRSNEWCCPESTRWRREQGNAHRGATGGCFTSWRWGLVLDGQPKRSPLRKRAGVNPNDTAHLIHDGNGRALALHWIRSVAVTGVVDGAVIQLFDCDSDSAKGVEQDQRLWSGLLCMATQPLQQLGLVDRPRVAGQSFTTFIGISVRSYSNVHCRPSRVNAILSLWCIPLVEESISILCFEWMRLDGVKKRNLSPVRGVCRALAEIPSISTGILSPARSRSVGAGPALTGRDWM